MADVTKLALGTVQFGLAYGISNRSGQVPGAEVARILARARAAGVDTLDTAIGYGESEAQLGRAGVRDWKVVTKLSPVPGDCADVAAWVSGSLRASMERLGVTRVHGLLMHRAADLAGPHGRVIHAALMRARSEGLAEKIGVSIYGPADLDALPNDMPIQLLQAPFNLLDRRLERSGWLARTRAAGIEVHVRSVFLQGLLLMAPGDRPARFDRWHDVWDTYEGWLAETGSDRLAACLAFVSGTPGIDRIVVGVESVGQLDGIVAAAGARLAVPLPDIGSDDEDLINPSRWTRH